MAEVFQEKQGYKYTEEFGYIPEDWEYIKLDDVFDFIAGGDVDRKCFSPHWTVEHRYPIYSNTLENDGLYGWSSKYTVNKDAITITGRGEVGHVFYHKANFTPIIRLVTGTAKRKINVKSLSYFIKKIKFRNESTGVPQLIVPQVQKYMIAYPSDIKEQENIAEALGDIDSLIDKTQQLINKKKDIKTATMQKLLTPKGDWEYKTFDSLGKNISVNNLSWEDTDINGKTKCILYGELFTTYNEIAKSIVSKTNKDVYIAQINDLLFPTSTTVDNMSLIAPSCLLEDNVGVGGDLFIFRPYDSNGVFLSYLINGRLEIKRQLANRAQGLTIVHLHYDNIKNIKLPIPNKEVQQQIATILSDMDAEIEALEKELNKYKDLKTGMMQQLLTGKIRLRDKSSKQDSKVVSIENIVSHRVANNEFKDAILISMLAYKYGTEQYPLGAFRRQKLSYFYKRHANMNIKEYMKKAMGPYNSKMKYQGAENIAIRNQYVRKIGNRGIVAASLISKAEEYYNKYYNAADMQWLDINFHYESNNNLEVLATIDYAINDLVSQNKDITLENIKAYIASDKEWKPKLDLDYFTNEAIIKAMEKIKKLFNSY